jgi:hypothetical protein
MIRAAVGSYDGNLEREDCFMQEYDLYINSQKPTIGLYVRSGAGLPDLANSKEWVFDGTADAVDLPPDLVRSIETRGHAFRDMD